MKETTTRTSGKSDKIPKEEFMKRFQRLFCDTHFDPFRDSLQEISKVVWENFKEGRKAPSTSPAGSDYADPEYELSADWLGARNDLPRINLQDFASRRYRRKND